MFKETIKDNVDLERTERLENKMQKGAQECRKVQKDAERGAWWCVESVSMTEKRWLRPQEQKKDMSTLATSKYAHNPREKKCTCRRCDNLHSREYGSAKEAGQ